MPLVEIRIDAASKGNPGISGAGIVIKHEKEYSEYSLPLGIYTNHEAEFLALLKALEICRKEFPASIIAVQTDSKIVVDAIEKNYVKNETFKTLLSRINEVKNTFSLFFIKWIPSNENKRADQLARQAIQKQLNKS